ncbi:DUF4395 domain-containing protein [Sutcliffiella cohnii]
MNKTVPMPLVTLNQWFIFIIVLLSLSTGIYHLLWLPFITGIIGLLFKKNPIILIGSQFLRKHKSSYPQEEIAQLQFNQTIAVTCLGISLIGFNFGIPTLGFIFAIMVGLAALVANLGFCVGCFIRFQWQQYQFRRQQNNG